MNKLPRCWLSGLVLLASVARAQPPGEAGSGLPGPAPRRLSERWPASWIALPDAPKNGYGVFLFRKGFNLAGRPEHFVVHVTGDARYRLWVNGRSVSFGPQRSDPMYWRFDSIDLAPWLHPGRNVLAAQVWSYGEEAPYAIMSRQTGFLLQGDTAAEELVDTNETWKVARDDAYQPLPPDRARLQTYIVTGPGDRVDAARHPWGWSATDFNDAGWRAARPLEQGTPHGWGSEVSWWLTPRSIPLMEETSQRLARVRRSSGVQPAAGFVGGTAPLTVPAHTKATVLLDQGFETNAFPQLTVSGGRGGRVTLAYAEALFDLKGLKGNRDEIDQRELVGRTDEFQPDGGAHRLFAPLDFRTYRYLQLEVETGDEALVVEDLEGIFTAYPLRQRATFASDDPELARIWQVGWRTARLCAFETYTDCPYYEQLQYVGDTRIQSLISLYVAGDDRLMRNAIELFDHSRLPDGMTQSRYPSATPQLINTFALFWVEMIHDYWWHRQDDAFLRARLTGMGDALSWFERRIDPQTGLLGPLAFWTFVDWAKEWVGSEQEGNRGAPEGVQEGGSGVVSLQLAMTLRHAAEVCRALGSDEQARHYELVAAGLRESVVRLCWDAKRRLFADTAAKRNFSQHANVLAVLSGAIEGEAARDLMQRVAADPSLTQCTTYFRFYLLRAMKQVGLGDEYLAMLGPWHDMLALGLTTFAEQPEPTRSDCHAWSASPLYEFIATVLGIEPASPGFATVRIEPHLGRLQRAQGSLPHPKGDIRVALERSPGGLSARITLPAGLTGAFVWQGKSTALQPGEQTLVFP
jgi:hypothetical protein